jgi:hypothetical protein
MPINFPVVIINSLKLSYGLRRNRQCEPDGCSIVGESYHSDSEQPGVDAAMLYNFDEGKIRIFLHYKDSLNMWMVLRGTRPVRCVKG